jgi:PAS domain S-box-containing protein
MKKLAKSKTIISNTNVKEAKNILQLEAVIEESHDAIIGKTLDGVIVSWNGGATRMFGYTRDEMVGKSIADLFAPGNRDELPGLLERIKKGETIADYDSIWIKKDGTNADVEFSISPIHAEKGLIIGSSLVGRDISERKKAEKITREAEKQYRDFFDTSQDGVFITSEDGKFIDFNDSAMKIFGYNSREEGYKVSVFSIYESPEERPVFLDIINKQGYVKEYPIRLKRKDGLILDTLITIKIYQNESTSEKRYFGTVRDITEKKKSEKKILEEEERLKVIFEEAPDAYYLMDTKGVLIDGNKMAEKVTGYKKEELVGKSFLNLKLLSGSELPKAVSLLAKNLLGQTTGPDEFTLHKKDGSSISVEITTQLAIINNKKFILGIARDITERKEANIKTKISEEKFKTIFNGSNDGILVAEIENKKFILANTTIIKMLGYSEEEISSLGVMDIHPEKDIPFVTEQFERQFKKEIEIAYNLPVKRKDGSVFYADVNSAPINIAGKSCLLGFFRDVTERKKAEQLIIDSSAKISELQRTKNEFVSIAAHQLKAPITTILGFTSIFEEGMKNRFTKEQKESIKIIEKSTQNMNDLVNFLLKITRAETGKMKMELTPINLKEIMDSVIEIIGSELDNKNQTVVINQNPNPFPYVFLDREIIKQVVQNLISNSSRYSPKDSKIEISMRLTDSIVEVSIKDSGIGIPREVQSKIFERFFRADNAKAIIPEGTGLGLSLVKSFVEAWGGKLWFESEENKGTTFYFTMPIMGSKEANKEIVL